MAPVKGRSDRRAPMRLASLCALVFAMFVSSLIPSGYMPSQDQAWVLTICTPDGPRDISMSMDDPAPHSDAGTSQAACVFAGLAQLAIQPIETAVIAIRSAQSAETLVWPDQEVLVLVQRSAASPRAPPKA